MSVEDAVVRLKQLVTTHPELQGVALNLLSVQHKAAVDRLLQEPLVSITQALKSASALVFWMHSNGMPPTQEATTRMLDSAGAVVRSAGRERWQAAAAAAAAAEAASTAAVKGVEELLSKARKELRAAEERATTAEERARAHSMDLLQHEVAVMVVEARYEAAEAEQDRERRAALVRFEAAEEAAEEAEAAAVARILALLHSAASAVPIGGGGLGDGGGGDGMAVEEDIDPSPDAAPAGATSAAPIGGGGLGDGGRGDGDDDMAVEEDGIAPAGAASSAEEVGVPLQPRRAKRHPTWPAAWGERLSEAERAENKRHLDTVAEQLGCETYGAFLACDSGPGPVTMDAIRCGAPIFAVDIPGDIFCSYLTERDDGAYVIYNPRTQVWIGVLRVPGCLPTKLGMAKNKSWDFMVSHLGDGGQEGSTETRMSESLDVHGMGVVIGKMMTVMCYLGAPLPTHITPSQSATGPGPRPATPSLTSSPHTHALPVYTPSLAQATSAPCTHSVPTLASSGTSPQWWSSCRGHAWHPRIGRARRVLGRPCHGRRGL